MYSLFNCNRAVVDDLRSMNQVGVDDSLIIRILGIGEDVHGMDDRGDRPWE